MKVTDITPWRSGSMLAGRTSTDSDNLLQAGVNRVLDELLHTAPLAWPAMQFPETDDIKVDVSDTGKTIRVTAELPGMGEDSVDVRIHDDELVISGEKHEDREVGNKGFLLRERRYGRVERSIPLPEGLDSDAARASFRDGVLMVEIPKAGDATRIAIHTT